MLALPFRFQNKQAGNHFQVSRGTTGLVFHLNSMGAVFLKHLMKSSKTLIPKSDIHHLKNMTPAFSEWVRFIHFEAENTRVLSSELISSNIFQSNCIDYSILCGILEQLFNYSVIYSGKMISLKTEYLPSIYNHNPMCVAWDKFW